MRADCTREIRRARQPSLQEIPEPEPKPDAYAPG
jgi:hypothetical protein